MKRPKKPARVCFPSVFEKLLFYLGWVPRTDRGSAQRKHVWETHTHVSCSPAVSQVRTGGEDALLPFREETGFFIAGELRLLGLRSLCSGVGRKWHPAPQPSFGRPPPPLPGRSAANPHPRQHRPPQSGRGSLRESETLLPLSLTGSLHLLPFGRDCPLTVQPGHC